MRHLANHILPYEASANHEVLVIFFSGILVNIPAKVLKYSLLYIVYISNDISVFRQRILFIKMSAIIPKILTIKLFLIYPLTRTLNSIFFVHCFKLKFQFFSEATFVQTATCGCYKKSCLNHYNCRRNRVLTILCIFFRQSDTKMSLNWHKKTQELCVWLGEGGQCEQLHSHKAPC